MNNIFWCFSLKAYSGHFWKRFYVVKVNMKKFSREKWGKHRGGRIRLYSRESGMVWGGKIGLILEKWCKILSTANITHWWDGCVMWGKEKNNWWRGSHLALCWEPTQGDGSGWGGRSDPLIRFLLIMCQMGTEN
jgi:hypothetical protein